MISKKYEIRPITLDDVDAFTACAEIVIATNGREGTPIFCGYDDVTPYSRVKKAQLYRTNLAKSTSDLGWQRSWGIFDEAGIMYGDVSFWTGEHNSTRHRATLGMGLKPEVRGMGFGARLMQTALDWAKMQPILAYIDLGVLEGNDRAISLYKKFGFIEVGHAPDRFRVRGKSVGDFTFTLSLEKLR